MAYMSPEDPSTANRVLGEIGLADRIRAVGFIDAGFSADRKYLVTLRDGAELVLRLSALGDEQARRFEFETIAQLRADGVLCPETIRFGIYQDLCFGLYSYIPGDCATDALPGLSVSEQYGIGIHAGKQLQVIHYWSAPPVQVDEFAVRGAKYNKHSIQLSELGITFAGQVEAHKYAKANMHLLQGRPTTFRHGDFHPSNLIIQRGELTGVIDFNRCDWGDPFDDFYKTAFFGFPVSEAFASGLVIGYFGGNPPDDFWPLYNLYVAATLPADIVWSHQLFPHELPKSITRVERITRTHDFHSGGPPTWFGSS